MPRTRFDKPNRVKRYEKLLVLIRGTADVQGKNASDLAKMMKCASTTVYNRFQQPERFTLGELAAISRGLNIPIEEIRQCIMN